MRPIFTLQTLAIGLIFCSNMLLAVSQHQELQLGEVYLSMVPKGSWEFEEAEEAWKNNQFEKLQKGNGTIKSYDSEAWLTFTVTASRGLDHKTEGVLHAGDYFEDNVDLYYRLEGSNRIIHMKTGEYVLIQNRPVQSLEPTFPIEQHRNTAQRYFVKLDSVIDVQPSVWVESIQSFYQHKTSVDTRTGIHLGILLGLFLYNVFVYLGFKRPEFKWYLYYLFSFGLFMILFQNLHLYWFIFPSPWYNYVGSISVGISTYCLIQFSRNFLNTRIHLPFLNSVLKGFSKAIIVNIVICLGIAGLINIPIIQQSTLLEFTSFFGDLLVVMTAFIVVLLPLVGLLTWNKGVVEARFFTLAFFGFFIGVIPAIYAQLGFKYRVDTDFTWIQIGSALELILFSLALSHKLSLLQKEKEIAQETALEEGNKRIFAEATSAKILEQKSIIENNAALLEESNQLLKKNNEEKSEILGVVAHDLRSPMAAIIGLVQLIKLNITESETDDSQQGENLDLLQEIEAAATRVIDSADQMLEVTAFNYNGPSLHMEKANLSHLVAHSIRINEQHAQKKSIVLHPDVEQDLYSKFDPNAIADVLENLISNAIKYSPENSKISVECREKNSHMIELKIRDQGPGFTKDDLKNLFHRFTPLSAKPTGGEKSTGLGLFSAKKKMDLHHFQMELTSPPGESAEFTLRFPKS